MISKLLDHDRTLWVLSAILYFLLGLGATLYAGPLSWEIRAETGGTAGSAGLTVGVVAGLLFAASMLAVLSTRRLRRLLVPVGAPVVGVIAAVIASISLEPSWLGATALLPALICLPAFLGSRRTIAYQERVEADAKLPKGKREVDSVNLGKIARGGEPDLFIAGGLGVLLTATGVIACLSVATMTTWFAPPLPEELDSGGQVVVGEGNPVEVKMLFGINYPHTAQLLGDKDSSLSGLVEDGTVELTTQGVSDASETRLSVPVREAEACAWEVGGADATFDFMTAYNKLLAAGGSTDSDPEEVTMEAGKDLGEPFSSCLKSGKYELQAAKSLEGSAKYVEAGLPQVYINGEAVKPETLEDLVEMINEAS